MNDFYFYNPTKIIFGKNSIKNITKEIPKNTRILFVYGMESIKKNKVFDQVKEVLKEYTVFEFGGVKPNPCYEYCTKAIDYVKEKKIDFLLAVGGGSVIDAVKFISLASCSNRDDYWDFVFGNDEKKQVIPFGCISTLPASGSETNCCSVISREKTKEKAAFSNFLIYPKFSILDPEITYSLTNSQIAKGIVDIFVHVLEQYITYPDCNYLQDRQAEAILITLKEISEKIFKDLKNYQLRASLMWCAVQAFNGTISRGVPQDWATHNIGHELTAMCGLEHSETLAIILPGVWENQFTSKKAKLAQYGSRVWDIKGTAEETALKAIEYTETFFKDIAVGTRFCDYKLDAEKVAYNMMMRMGNKKINFGEHKNIDIQEIVNIIMSRK